MSSLSDRLAVLDIGEHLVVDVIDGIDYNPNTFKKTLDARVHLFCSRVTNKQRLRKDLQNYQFSATKIRGLNMDEDGNLCQFVKIKRVM